MKGTIGELVVGKEGQFLEVSPALDGLKQVLHTSIHVPHADDRGYLTMRKVASQLYRERSDEGVPVLECFAGLLPIVLRFAESAGYAARIQRKEAAVLPEPDYSSTENLPLLDRGFLRCVQLHDRALVRYDPSAVDPALLVAQVALAWPQLSLVVAVTRVEEARWLRDQLRTHLPAVVAVTSRNRVPDSQVGRVTVATYTGLGSTGIEIEKCNILLAWNAVEASRPNALSCLGHARRARMYGLLAGTEPQAPFDRDVVRLLFGFKEVEVPWPSRVEVVWCRNVRCPAMPEGIDTVQVKRHGLWRNHARNRQVARFARKLQAGEWQAIQKCLPSGAAGLVNGSQATVVVLVENVEHAEALARFLRGWRIARHHCWNPGGVGQGIHESTGSLGTETGNSQGFIATALGIKALDVTQIDVLIRADAGVGLASLMPFSQEQILLRKNNLPEHRWQESQLLLVDFEDRHHPLLRRWSRLRRVAYEERGWYAPGVDPLRARVDRFLADRR
jgi:hypothetical protein